MGNGIYLPGACTIGWFNIHSAVFDEAHPGIFGILIPITASNFFSFIVFYRYYYFTARKPVFYRPGPVFYGIYVFLLLLVLVIGRNVGGNQAWISFGGGFRLQPSEFAKFTTCLLLARYLSGANIRVTELIFFIAAAIIGVPMLLIMLQPDVGSTLVFSRSFFVLYREGLSPYFLIIGGLFISFLF